MKFLLSICLALSTFGLCAQTPFADVTLAQVPYVSGGSSFTYYSAYFDGANDYLSRGADFTGAVDTNRITISFWLYLTNLPSGGDLFRIISSGTSGGGLQVYVDDTGVMSFVPGGGSGQLAPTATTSVPLNGWVNYLYCYDTDANGWKLYTNDVSASSSSTTYDRPYDATVGDFYVGRYSLSDLHHLKGWLCELFYTTESLDLSTTGNRRKFITAGLKPANLGSDGSTPFGVAPLLYLHNQVPNWEVNLGGGGGLTETGTLQDGGANIP